MGGSVRVPTSAARYVRKVIAEISSPKAAEAEAELIREQLRGTVVHYELPAEPAHAREEWAVYR